jgi:hypothetical protein
MATSVEIVNDCRGNNIDGFHELSIGYSEGHSISSLFIVTIKDSVANPCNV